VSTRRRALERAGSDKRGAQRQARPQRVLRTRLPAIRCSWPWQSRASLRARRAGFAQHGGQVCTVNVAAHAADNKGSEGCTVNHGPKTAGDTHMSRSARATGGALASSTPSTSSGRARIAGVGAFRGALLSLGVTLGLGSTPRAPTALVAASLVPKVSLLRE